MKQIAIIGPTASGKTDIALTLAKNINANILSLDSLSIYKEIDIASAKPTKEQRDNIKHFGIDEIYINEHFSVTKFFDIYKNAYKITQQESKSLIIVGGTSFYLKSMIDGLSYKIQPSNNTLLKVQDALHDLQQAYNFIKKMDFYYANKISSHDSYRIQKWYEIYFETNIIATKYFKQNLKKPLIKDIEIYNIEINKETLKQKISQRTSKMISSGLIDEVFKLEKKYTREPKPMKAIGIAETLEYLDGKLSFKMLHDKISLNTLKLAKRQITFNKSQFNNIRNMNSLSKNMLK